MSCIISKIAFNDYGRRDIQTNVEWSEERQGGDFALVPDDLIEGIVATEGFCDLELSDDENVVIAFTAREIPELPGYEELSLEQRVKTVESDVASLTAAIEKGLSL